MIMDAASVSLARPVSGLGQEPSTGLLPPEQRRLQCTTDSLPPLITLSTVVRPPSLHPIQIAYQFWTRAALPFSTSTTAAAPLRPSTETPEGPLGCHWEDGHRERYVGAQRLPIQPG